MSKPPETYLDLLPAELVCIIATKIGEWPIFQKFMTIYIPAIENKRWCYKNSIIHKYTKQRYRYNHIFRLIIKSNVDMLKSYTYIYDLDSSIVREICSHIEQEHHTKLSGEMVVYLYDNYISHYKQKYCYNKLLSYLIVCAMVDDNLPAVRHIMSDHPVSYFNELYFSKNTRYSHWKLTYIKPGMFDYLYKTYSIFAADHKMIRKYIDLACENYDYDTASYIINILRRDHSKKPSKK